MGHGAATNSIEVEAPALFDRVARKWNVDYAFYQVAPDTYGEFKAVRDDLHRLWKVKSCVDTAARFNERTEEQKLQNRPQTRQKKEELSR